MPSSDNADSFSTFCCTFRRPCHKRPRTSSSSIPFYLSHDCLHTIYRSPRRTTLRQSLADRRGYRFIIIPQTENIDPRILSQFASTTIIPSFLRKKSIKLNKSIKQHTDPSLQKYENKRKMYFDDAQLDETFEESYHAASGACLSFDGFGGRRHARVSSCAGKESRASLVLPPSRGKAAIVPTTPILTPKSAPADARGASQERTRRHRHKRHRADGSSRSPEKPFSRQSPCRLCEQLGGCSIFICAGLPLARANPVAPIKLTVSRSRERQPTSFRRHPTLFVHPKRTSQPRRPRSPCSIRINEFESTLITSLLSELIRRGARRTNRSVFNLWFAVRNYEAIVRGNCALIPES